MTWQSEPQIGEPVKSMTPSYQPELLKQVATGLLRLSYEQQETGEQAGSAGAASTETRSQEGPPEDQHGTSSSTGNIGGARSDTTTSRPFKKLRKDSEKRLGTDKGNSDPTGKPSGRVHPVR